VPTIAVRGDSRRGAYLRRTVPNARDRDEHGLAAYQKGCRCSVCVQDRRRYDRTVYAARKLARTGVAHWKVPNRNASRHVARLIDAGWSIAAIARRAGVSAPTIHRIASRPSGRCWNTVADGILAIHAGN
jgi:hypothetical protein